MVRRTRSALIGGPPVRIFLASGPASAQVYEGGPLTPWAGSSPELTGHQSLVEGLPTGEHIGQEYLVHGDHPRLK